MIWSSVYNTYTVPSIERFYIYTAAPAYRYIPLACQSDLPAVLVLVLIAPITRAEIRMMYQPNICQPGVRFFCTVSQHETPACEWKPLLEAPIIISPAWPCPPDHTGTGTRTVRQRLRLIISICICCICCQQPAAAEKAIDPKSIRAELISKRTMLTKTTISIS